MSEVSNETMSEVSNEVMSESSNVRLIVDNNEKGEIKDIFKAKGYEFRTLPLGDYLYERINSDNTVTPLLLIERKTESDLANSIQTGRYRNQKMRLMSQDIKVAYLIEGVKCTHETQNDTVPNSSLKKSTIMSAILNCTVRDNLTVYSTATVDESVYLLETLITKMGNTDVNKVVITYADTIKQKKGDNMTPSLCYQLQLSQIPGVSTRIAEQIVIKYSSMRMLMEAYNSVDESKRSTLLTDIKGIGKVLSKRVYEYLYN